MLELTDVTDLTRKDLTAAIIRDPITVSSQLTVRDAIALMSGARSSCEANSTTQSASNHVQLEARASCVIVVESDKVTGILTERDVVRLCASQQLLAEMPIGQVMTASVLTVRESAFTDLFSIINVLQQNHIRHLPVVDDQDCLVGLATHETLRQLLQPTDLLHLRLVQDVMTPAVITTAPTDSLLAIAQQMVSHRVSSVIVVESDRPEGGAVPIGLVTERDLVQFQALELNFERYYAAQVMSCPVIAVPPTETLVTVQQLMERYRVRRVVVTGDAGELLGIVTQTNLLQVLSPLELYKLTEVLETRVKQLETEKIDLLKNRNSQLEEQVASRTVALQQQVQRAQIVAQLATQIRSSLSLQTILDTAVEQIHQVIGSDRAMIWKFETDGTSVVVAESTTSPHSLMGERVQDKCYQQYITNIYNEGYIRVVSDIYTTEMSECHQDLLIRLHMRAKVLLPLFCGEQLWGLLGVAESQTARDWQADEIELLRTLATQLTIAIQQASTYEQLQAELQERQQAEVQLQQSTARLQEAQRIAHVGNWELDLERDTLHWSEEIFRIFEIDPQQFGASYEAFLSLVHPEDHATVNEAYSQHLSDRQPYSLVHRLQMADGRIKYVQERCETTFSADGTPLISQGTVQDITQQQEAEIYRDQAELERLLAAQALEQLNAELEARVTQRTTELAEREARYRGLLEGAADAILLTDLQGNILEANQKAEALFGYPLAELTTLHFTQLHPAEELPRATASFAEMTRQHHLQVLDVTCQRADGTTMPVDITASVIDLGGEILVQGIVRDVSERKAAEQALQESRQFLQTVLDTVPLSVFWKDRSGYYLGANQRFLRDAGLSSTSELMGKTDFDMPWKATEGEAYRMDDRAVMESGEAKLGIIETLHRQNGTEIYLETNKLPLHNLAGEIIGILGTYQDITERRNAEMVLQRQLAAIEAAVDGIAILQDGRYLYLNSSHVKMFGYGSAEELIGQGWRSLYSAEELDRFDREVFPALMVQQSWQGEAIATRKDGTTFPEQLSLTRLGDDLLICVCQDISERAQLDAERKQAEAALRESEWRYATLTQAAPAAIFRFDLEGRCIYVNKYWCKMTGKPAAFAMSDRWLETIHPDDREHSQAIVQQWLQSGAVTPFHNEARILRDDGSIVWYYCQMLVETDVNGQPIGYAGTLTDISDRKAAEAELYRTNAELERATRLKDEFLANMSHELRTPLNAILGMTEGLQEEVFGIVNERQLKALHTVEKSATHLLTLINDILDVAKIESGQVKLDYSHVSIEQLCSSSLTFVKQQAIKKRIQLSTQIPPHLPDLFVDEVRIRQVLLNLLTNAVKFTEPGGTVTLTVSPLPPAPDAPQTTYLRIAITDTGIGIAPENISKLFKPFVQIDGALNRKHMGTGLGLALVKQIVELHDGQIGLTSELGVGSCFTVDLPYLAAVSHPGQPEQLAIAHEADLHHTHPGQPAPIQAPLVLLAEDTPDNVAAIASYLEAKGYRLIYAIDGQEAIDLALSHQPDLILMDIQMPGVDGLEAIMQIRQQESLHTTPIIALTALAMKGDQERCLAAGADSYLSKPVKLKQLDLSIKELLPARQPE